MTEYIYHLIQLGLIVLLLISTYKHWLRLNVLDNWRINEGLRQRLAATEFPPSLPDIPELEASIEYTDEALLEAAQEDALKYPFTMADVFQVYQKYGLITGPDILDYAVQFNLSIDEAIGR